LVQKTWCCHRSPLDGDAIVVGANQYQPAAGLKPTFPVFTKEELLTDMECGGTPLSRAVINVNLTFQALGKR
jgi:hypothetical protein